VSAPSTRGFRARLEASLAGAGLAIPWWVAVCASSFGGVLGLVAMAQRSFPVPSAPMAVGAVLTMTSPLVYFTTGRIAPPALKSAAVVAGVTILLTAPVVPDFAPVVLVVLAADVSVTARPALTFTVTGVSVALVGAAGLWEHLVGSPVYVAAVLLGFAGGSMMRWYIRALEAERGEQESAREQALLMERQRIAREVHDVVGHSLSITLLHLTGARRALQQDRDVDEAVEALTEAERVGRLAMTDIRRTVGLLARSSSGTRSLPGIEDLAGLVERTRAAGLDVRYEQRGNLAAVGASAGLGLYRIAQESLANIAKHAPDATALVHLCVDADGTRLAVRNGLPPGVPGGAVSGSGLSGMSARATQLGAKLSAGPSGDHWVVDVTVPGEAP
jgi:signal transduction histidine kinase